MLIIWGILVAASVNWSGPVWVPLELALNTTIDDLNLSAALCFAFLAVGCILLQPTAMKIGRRPVYIIGTFLNLVGCVIGGLQRTVEVYYAVNILTGFGAAPVDTLVQITTTDIFFAHERGTRLACFALALGTGSYMGPVAAGYITESQGWRWCFRYLVIFFGILLLVQIFTLEESTFSRPPPGPGPPTPVFQLRPTQAGDRVDLEDKPQSVVTSRSNTVDLMAFEGRKVTYWQRMAPIHTRHANPKPWWFLALFPFRLFLFPAVVWIGFLGGIQIMWLSLLSVTQSEIFSEDPYDFGIAAVGDTNIAAFVGGLFGMLWGGPLSDWWVLRCARRNRGIMEPETRLWLLIVPAVINTAGLLMYGLGAYRGLHWIISAGVGTAFIGFGIGSGGAIGLTYAIDCYSEIAAEGMVLILFMRNVIGFAFTFAIQSVLSFLKPSRTNIGRPWIDARGGEETIIILSVICITTTMSFLVFARWGKAFRKRTAQKYLRYVEQRSRRRELN